MKCPDCGHALNDHPRQSDSEQRRNEGCHHGIHGLFFLHDCGCGLTQEQIQAGGER